MLWRKWRIPTIINHVLLQFSAIQNPQSISETITKQSARSPTSQRIREHYFLPFYKWSGRSYQEKKKKKRLTISWHVLIMHCYDLLLERYLYYSSEKNRQCRCLIENRKGNISQSQTENSRSPTSKANVSTFPLPEILGHVPFSRMYSLCEAKKTGTLGCEQSPLFSNKVLGSYIKD